jgi:PAS domain S-box-containing protein
MAEMNDPPQKPFRMQVEGVRDYAIFMLDPEGHVSSWNTGAQLIKGYRPEEILGKHFSIFYQAGAVERGWPEHELRVARKEGRFEDEGWRVRKDGSVFWANVVITALYDENGELKGFLKITRDLTVRRRQEDLLRESEERFRLLIEGVKDYAIFMLDPEGRISSWNQGAQLIKGYRPEEILGKHFSVFYPAEAVARGWPEHELRVAREVGRFEDEGWRVRKDGSVFWANVIITALYGAKGELKGFSKITRDLTERRRQEELLKESEERFRLLVQGVKDYAIFMLDPEGHISSWNQGAQLIKGYRPEEILGKHFSVFYPADDRASGWPEHELRVAREEGRFEHEGWRVRKDGSTFWANVVITALYDHRDRLLGFAKVTRDLTDRKRIEALEEADLRRNEFLAMLSHELRNPLAPIRNALGVMRMNGVSESALEWAKTVVDRQVTHLTRLVDDLLDVSRIASGKITLHREPVELAQVAASAVESSQPLIDSRGHTLELRLSDEPLRVEGDLTRLSQVVMNLLNNAAKYTPEGGHIRLTTERDGAAAVIRVRDTGVGMPTDLLPKVFDLFTQGDRSLDRSEGGLGIGLTLVYRLVTLHGGSVEAKSEGPGLGSEFTIRLPLLTAEEAPRPRSGPQRVERRSDVSRRVLVVDDNQDATETLELLLQLWGHEVRIAYDGEGALAQVAELRPDIVLLDIGLPGMSGYEVARRMRALPECRDVMLVAVTGYGQDSDRRQSQEAGFDHHLVKPVQPGTLRDLIASAPLLHG